MFQCERCTHEFDDSMDLRRHSKQNTCSLNTIRLNAPRLPAIVPISASSSPLISSVLLNIAQPVPITPSPALAQFATISSGVLPQPDDDEGRKVALLIYILFTQTHFT